MARRPALYPFWKTQWPQPFHLVHLADIDDRYRTGCSGTHHRLVGHERFPERSPRPDAVRSPPHRSPGRFWFTAKLAENGVRAGSTLTQNVALKNLLKFTGKSLEEILPLLTENPANLIKIADHKGFIADGMDADLVVLDPDFEVFDTFVGGRKVTSEDSNI